MPYIQIPEREVPANVRWTIPAQNQGQIVEVAYGHFGLDDAGPGDLFERHADQAITGAVRRTGEGVEYFKRIEETR